MHVDVPNKGEYELSEWDLRVTQNIACVIWPLWRMKVKITIGVVGLAQT